MSQSRIRRLSEFKGGCGRRVKTLEFLSIVALSRRSVLIEMGPGQMWLAPAAFVISQQANMVLRHMQRGMYVYEKGQD